MMESTPRSSRCKSDSSYDTDAADLSCNNSSSLAGTGCISREEGPVLQPRSKNYIAYFWDLDYYIVPKLKEKICGLHGLSRARIIWGWLPEDGFHSGWHFGIHLEFSFARNIQPDDLAVQFDDVGQVEPADLVAPEDGKISIDMPFYDGEVEELEVRP